MNSHQPSTYRSPAPRKHHHQHSHHYTSAETIDDDDADDDGHSNTDGVFYVVRKPHKRPAYSAEDNANGVFLVHKPLRQQPHKKKKIVVEVQDYNDDFADAQPAATQYRQRHRDDDDDGDVDGNLSGSAEAQRDYDVSVQQERYRKQQPRHRRPAQSGYHSQYYDHSPSYRSRRPTENYQSHRAYARPAASSAAAGSDRHRHHRYEEVDTDRFHRSQLRKKYIWDRQTDFGQPPLNRFSDALFGAVINSGEDATSVEQLDDDDNDQFSRRRTGSTGVQRPVFNYDLNNRLDRNYAQFIGNGGDETAGALPHYNAQTATVDSDGQQQLKQNNDQEIGEAETADEADYSDATDSDDPATADATADVVERRQFRGSQFQRRWDGPPEGTTLNFEPIPHGADNGTSTWESRREKAVFDVGGPIRRNYGKWTKWSKCSAKCTTKRSR